MTILFLILKIIGCIFLALLLLVILFLLLLLFVPVRYRISANMDKDTWLRGGVSWLLHLVALTGVYEDGKFHLKLRVLFFSKLLMDSAQAKSAAEEGKEETAESLKRAAKEVTDDSKLWDMPEDEYSEDSLKKPDVFVQPTEIKEKLDSTPDAGVKENSTVSDDKKAADHTQKKRRRKKGIPVFIQLAQDFIRRIKELQKNAGNVISKIQSIKDDSGCRSALTHLKEELFLLLKVLWPRKLRMNIQFSAGVPDKTGQILGVCAMFPITYSKGNMLIPDFETEKAYAKGYASLKGRVYLYQIVGIVIRIIFDKNCRRLLHRIRT